MPPARPIHPARSATAPGGLERDCRRRPARAGKMGWLRLVASFAVGFGRCAMPWPNGLYEATSGLGTSYTMLLRVDLAGPEGGAGYVSLDLYRGFLTEASDDPEADLGTLLYLGSFRSGQLPAQPGPDVTLVGLPEGLGTITLSFQGWADAADAEPRVVVYEAARAGPGIPRGPLGFEAT